MMPVPNVVTVAVFLSIGLLFNFASLLEDERCSININHDLIPRNAPLLLKHHDNKNSLIFPKLQRRNGLIELNKNEEIILACPGKNNYLLQIGGKAKDTSTSCISGTDLYSNISKTRLSLQKISCAQPVEGEVIITSGRCAQIGKIYEIGFQVKGWHKLISVCHDLTLANTMYTNHTLFGSVLEGAEQENYRPRFKKGDVSELYPEYNPENFYLKKNQEILFKNLFGAAQAKKYFNEINYLTRGHLAPDADFLYGTWQFATYFHINAAPQWNTINSKNWLIIEITVRKAAINNKKDLTVFTGTYDILELADDNGKPKKLYMNLMKQNIPVPKYLWKVVYDPMTKQGISFIISNNPYLPLGSKILLCEDVCQKYNWSTPKIATVFTNVTRGLTICCTFSDLRKTIPHVPFLDVQNVLRGPPHFNQDSLLNIEF